MIISNRIAALIGEPFDATEIDAVVRELTAEGYRVEVIGRPEGPRRVADTMAADGAPVDVVHARPADYCALVIAGSALAWRSPSEAVLAFIRQFNGLRRPIATASWGIELLRAARLTDGRTVTGPETLWPSLREAGAEISTDLVAVDGSWVTSRDRGGAVLLAEALVARLKELYGGGEFPLEYP